MRINKKNHVFKWIFYVGILLSLFLFTYQVAAIANEDLDHDNQSITHEKVVMLTDKFMEQLVQEVDGDYKAIHFDTKQSLKASFENIAKAEVATEYIDFYYEETTDGLYILPTETPPWFIENNDYHVIQLERNQVEVVQENETDLYGQYKITYEFTFDNKGGWKITEINIA